MTIIELIDKKQQDKKYTATSLFCGAGGLDMGFENKGFHIAWANDYDEDACNTHKSWSDAEIVCDKIENIDFKSIPSTDIILVGFKKSLKINRFEFPKPFEYKVSLKDALENILEVSSEDTCDAPYSSRYMSRNRKRDWDQASYTIPAMAKQVPLHPSSPDMIKIDNDLWEFGDGKSRRFSWREAAAIQTFPAELEFYGDLTSKYKQIGNAVPVKLAEAIAESVL